MAEILERPVTVADPEGPYPATVEDMAIERERNRDWAISKVFVRQGGGGRSAIGPFRRRRGTTVVVPVEDVTGIHQSASAQSAALLLETYDDLKSADLADVIHDLSPKRRAEVAEAMDDDKLADVLEELPEDDQVEILDSLSVERAADVLEAMEPDDATDLLHNLTNLRSGIDWDATGDRVRDWLVADLEDSFGLEGLGSSIVAEHRMTPTDFRARLGARDGNAFALEPTLHQSASLRPANRDRRATGLYRVGGGTHPGAGIPGVLLGAEVTSALVSRDLGLSRSGGRVAART